MTDRQTYGYAVLGRVGLGNMLFPWARCYVWCLDHHLPMIAPFWTQLRLGPYLRRERDKRAYQFLFHHRGYVSGFQRLFLLSTYPRLTESDKGQEFGDPGSSRGIIVFQGMAGSFEEILSRSAEIAAELKRITRSQFVAPVLPERRFIGIHVRCGDFAVPTDTSVLRSSGVNYRIPMSWYAHVLRSLRASLGVEVPALLFSDGSEAQLQELLSEPGLTFLRNGVAITDLFALSQSRAIIASGSTFSAWASYLGQVPTVWYPGQRRQCVLGSGKSPQLEPEMEMEAVPSSSLIEAIGGRL